MKTIKEDPEDDNNSDTGYFPEDTHDFNNRDDNDSDSEEEDKEVNDRYEFLNRNEVDDEDH